MVSCNPAAGVVQGHEVGGHLSRDMLFQRKPADVSLSTTGNKGSVLRNTSSQGERPRARLGVRDRRQAWFWGQRGTGWRGTNRTQSGARTERESGLGQGGQSLWEQELCNVTSMPFPLLPGGSTTFPTSARLNLSSSRSLQASGDSDGSESVF